MNHDPEAEAGIRRTIAQYCHFCDDGLFEGFADLFAEDATFTVMGNTQQGRPAIRAFMEEAQTPDRRGQHHCANTVIELEGDTARAWTDYVFVARRAPADSGTMGEFAITSVGRYHDRLVRHDDRWRFTERRIEFLP